MSPRTQNKDNKFVGLIQKEIDVNYSILENVDQSCIQRSSEPKVNETKKEPEKEEGGEAQTGRRRSCSSSSSSEDYIIILPDCFDTSRPLGDSMYSQGSFTEEDVNAPKAREGMGGPELYHPGGIHYLEQTQTHDAEGTKDTMDDNIRDPRLQ
ncbi:next to BRCA1 gene 1 protein [Nematolebias whitei]|uniref:next to BRCA1 gene 1 protein n=1 Tax=Nematolebias whitei TaxID=451745 RepID=UPI001899BBC2|nr:next to BRCA1 gene 1 protein [Nematolebias whitei]